MLPVPTTNPILHESLVILHHYYPDLKIFVHGSWRKKGQFAKDIDLVVITQGFKGVATGKRIQIICRLLDEPNQRFDPVCLTPSEFKRLLRSDSEFASTVRKNMRQIWGQNSL